LAKIYKIQNTTSGTKYTVGAVAGIIAGAWLLSKLFSNDKSGGQSDESGNTKPDKKNLSYALGAYEIWADEIETSIFGSYGITLPWEDDEKIGEILKYMNTLDDVYQLINAYGRRYVGVFIQDGGNLAQTISSYLDEDIVSEVNQNYEQKNISFRW